MFFDLVLRNSRRSRKENMLYFASLIITIVAFYIILSLSSQDIMLYLAKAESDAVTKLLQMIPLFYCFTLVILFFLVCHASRYQMERRCHEFGVYLMMGMKRSRLFFMLNLEMLANSVLALAVGIPVAIFLAEIINLVTNRIVGLGIAGHRFSISGGAIVLTIVGFLLINFFAFFLLTRKLVKQEIALLLHPEAEGAKRRHHNIVYVCAFLLGVILTAATFYYAVRGFSWIGVRNMGITVLGGFLGIMLFFYGLSALLGFLAKHGKSGAGLSVFNFRQLQERVVQKPFVLAIGTILMFIALCCFGFGVATMHFYGNFKDHVIDYTFTQWEPEDDIRKTLQENNLMDLFNDIFDMRVGYIKTDNDYHQMETDDMCRMIDEKSFSTPVTAEDKERIKENFINHDFPYIISLSSYNQLLGIAGKPLLKIEPGEAAVYMDQEFVQFYNVELFNEILSCYPEIKLAGESCHLTKSLQSTTIVVNRAITLSFALIVPDDVFDRLTGGTYDTYVNCVLRPEIVHESSFFQSLYQVNRQLDDAGIYYDSYLSDMGRQLFYIVGSGYITIYLAIIFLMVANTVLGVQFLTGQQKMGRRYRTLICMGAEYDMLCSSSNKQINWYFGIPIIFAAVISLLGVRVLCTGLLSSAMKNNTPLMMFISAVVILFLCVVEWIYIMAVKKNGRNYILSLMTPERTE